MNKPIACTLFLASLISTAQAVEDFADDFAGPTLDPAWTQSGHLPGHIGISGGKYEMTATEGGGAPKLTRTFSSSASTSFEHEITVDLSPFLGTGTDFKWKSFGSEGNMEIVLNGANMRLWHNDYDGGADNIQPNVNIGITDGQVLYLKTVYDSDADTVTITYSIDGGAVTPFYSGGGVDGPIGDVISNFVEVELFNGGTDEDTSTVRIDEWNLTSTSLANVEHFTEEFPGPTLDPAWNQSGYLPGHIGISGGKYEMTATESDGGGGAPKLARNLSGAAEASYCHEITVDLSPFLGTGTDFKWKCFGPDGSMEVVLNGSNMRLWHNDLDGGADSIQPNVNIGITDGQVLYLKTVYDSGTDTVTVTYSIDGGAETPFYSGGGVDGPIGDVISNFVEVELFNGGMAEDTSTVRIDEWNLSPVAEAPPASDFTLIIVQTGSGLEFTWPSQDGKLYDLLSSTDLNTSPATWSPYNDGSNPTYENIAPSGTGTNTLSGVDLSGTTRFFVVFEKDEP